MNILILGPVGSGKSTQADLLAQDLGIPHLSVGDLLHYISEGNDPAAVEIKEKMQKGELVEDEVVIKKVEEQLKGDAYKNGVIVDGFPRNVREAEIFSHPIDKVIYLMLSDEEIRKRLSARGREDDTPSVIENRIKVYHEETEPLLQFYKNRGEILEIDASRTIQEISQDIRKKI